MSKLKLEKRLKEVPVKSAKYNKILRKLLTLKVKELKEKDNG
jgi:hypothetical protein